MSEATKASIHLTRNPRELNNAMILMCAYMRTATDVVNVFPCKRVWFRKRGTPRIQSRALCELSKAAMEASVTDTNKASKGLSMAKRRQNPRKHQ